MASALQLPVETPNPKPFLKWAGGKTQLVPEILQRFPQKFGRYFEPFLGGAAVFFALQPQRASLSDINPDLIGTYLAVRDDVEKVIRLLKKHEPSEKHFYEVRALEAANLNSPQAAARTIFLNRTCFNGLYRVNRRGEFNVPFGRYNNPTVCHEENLRRASTFLKHAAIQSRDVFTTCQDVERGDLVYFDPPYDPISPTASFTSYARDGFDKDQQTQLADTFATLARRGVHCVLSNSDTPFIRKLYKSFKIDEVYARRAINSRADRRGPITELLISAKSPSR